MISTLLVLLFSSTANAQNVAGTTTDRWLDCRDRYDSKKSLPVVHIRTENGATGVQTDQPGHEYEDLSNGPIVTEDRIDIRGKDVSVTVRANQSLQSQTLSGLYTYKTRPTNSGDSRNQDSAKDSKQAPAVESAVVDCRVRFKKEP